jgi:hypothetical protein
VIQQDDGDAAAAISRSADENPALAAARPSHRGVMEGARAATADAEVLQARLLSLAVAMPGFAELGEDADPLIAGAALNRVKADFLANVEAALTKARRDNADIPDVEALMADCLSRAAARPLAAKIAMLVDLKQLDFGTAGQRAAFRDWVVSAGKLRDPAEMRMLHGLSMAQMSKLEVIARNGDAQTTLNAFAQGIATVDREVGAWVASVKPGEFGPDDKMTEVNRVAFLSVAMLAVDSPDAARTVLEGLQSAEVHGVRAFLNSLEGEAFSGNLQLSNMGLAPVTGDFMEFTVRALSTQLGAEAPSHARTGLDQVNVPPTIRGIVAESYPGLMAEFDRVYPHREVRAYQPFPAAAVPGGLPATHEAMRGFMVASLGAYRAHEMDFDRQTAVHGMGHASRTFIFATVLANIMEERGAAVDRAALLCGTAGHDAGRKGNGADVWEEDSAEIIIGNMRAAYGMSSLGDDYEDAVRAMITDRNERGETLETLIHKAADSLDIGRTKDFDPKLWPFLREAVVVPGAVISRDTQNLRERLAAEVTRFQQITDPNVRYRDRIQALQLSAMDSAEPESVMRQVQELKDAVTTELAAMRNMGDEEYFAFFEQTIRDHARELPLLARYYR